jgi:hypothetical protein
MNGSLRLAIVALVASLWRLTMAADIADVNRSYPG